MELIRDLRLGEFDVLVGINLLREGLDLPEVSLVAILDADKEGFLRSETSLIQTIGRAARNAEGLVIMYADTITPSMRARHGRDGAPPQQAGRLQPARTASSPRPSARTCARCWRFPTRRRTKRRAQKKTLTAAEREATIRRAGKGDEGGQQDAGIRIRRRSARSDHRAARREIREVSAVPPRRGFECAGSPAYKRLAAGKALEWAEFTSGHSDEIGDPTGTASGEIRGCSERSDYRAARREIREVSAMPPRRGFECAGSPAYNSQFLNSFPS